MIPQKKIDFIKNKIRNDCECIGAGCKICYSKTSKVFKYAEAEIPVGYWNLSFKNDFSGDKNFGAFIISKINNIDEIYESGQSFAFIGNLGTGKTFGATSILKMAIVKGFTAKYYHMDQVIRLAISDESKAFFEEITKTDFVILDEYDSRWVYPSEKSERLFGQTMESILRHRFQNGMPTILCSNTKDIERVLSGDFERSTESLFSKYVKIVYVGGKDFRKTSI